MGQAALATFGVVIGALISGIVLLVIDRRRSREAAAARAEVKTTELSKADVDRAELLFDNYAAILKRVEEEAGALRAELGVVNKRLDDCLTERLENREERLVLERELSRIKRRLDRAQEGLSDPPEEDTPTGRGHAGGDDFDTPPPLS